MDQPEEAGVERRVRRRRSVAEKRRIVELTQLAGASVALVARAHSVNANQVFKWRREYERGELPEPASPSSLLPVVLSDTDRPQTTSASIHIEFESFVQPAFIDLLRKHNVALVAADSVEWPLFMDVTSDFVYLRLHGSEQLYLSGYEADAIEVWARRVVGFATGIGAEGRYAGPQVGDGRPRDVYVYFDNDAQVRAPIDAGTSAQSESVDAAGDGHALTCWER